MAKLALLIGVSEYEPGLNPLPGAVKDVDAVQQVLLHPEIGGFIESDVTVLKNPARQKMEEEIEKLFDNRQKDDLVLLFFSGHGIKDDTGKLYLATRHTRKTDRGELIRTSAVAANFVHDNMERSRSKRQVVILDSCFSGAFAEGLSAKDDGTVNIREQLGGEGRAVLTSSTSTQYSFEQQESDLSIYTRYLVEGMTTGAADLDGDGVVSIDELHEYAKRKVREIQPAMKPEIYAIREGFKIRLTKVPPGDPKEKYSKEVKRYASRGEVTFVGRKILDAHRIKLGLYEFEARAIEDEILRVARQQFQKKLQRYEQDFTEALQQEVPLSEAELDSLRQNLKQILGLRNEDIQPIEAQVKARIEAYKQHLQQYEQAFTEAMLQECPLSETTRLRLQQMQQQWELKEPDLTSIETRITAEIETYRQKLQQYEQAFNNATQQKYPLSEAQRHELRQQQQNLDLKDGDVAPIETRITAEIEAYLQKLQQYEQAFTKATQQEYPLTQNKRNQLRQQQQNLGLKDEDIAPIESRITAEIEAYRQKLQQYEQAFTNATQQEYPLTQNKRNQLRQQQQNLGLKDGDVAPITAEVEAYQQKLQDYEEVLRQTIQHEYPLSDEIREELKRYQGVLELRDEDVARIEARITAEVEALPVVSHPITPNVPPESPRLPPPSVEINRRKLLQWIGWTGAGVGATIIGRAVYQSAMQTTKVENIPNSSTENKLSESTFEFETITVNSKGEEISRNRKQAEYFTEDLGNGVKFEMVTIPGGTFKMGAPATEEGSTDDERPQHQVTVPAFYMGKFQVTQKLWKAVASLPKIERELKSDPAYFKGDDRPVERINWYDVIEFCKRLLKKTGREYRLPSESEWEYACRAGTTTPFYFGETITTDLVNFNGNYTYGNAPKGQFREETTPVGTFPPNVFGLYDMHGNVYEWCADRWHNSYKGAPTNGSAWLSENERDSRLLRGGSWDDDPRDCRSANRSWDYAGYGSAYVGLRLACGAART